MPMVLVPGRIPLRSFSATEEIPKAVAEVHDAGPAIAGYGMEGYLSIGEQR